MFSFVVKKDRMLTVPSGVDPYGTGGRVPQYLLWGHAYECPPPQYLGVFFLKHQYLAAT